MEFEIMNDTRRKTDNQSFPETPKSIVSGKIVSKAIALKALIQRDMPMESIEQANELCNALIYDAETVAMLEQAPLVGGYGG